jgi:DNA-binding transcriptional MerR regulator
MVGAGIRLYTDEDVTTALAKQLQRQGYHLADAWQLAYAAQDHRAIITHNISDFIRLDMTWKDQQQEHWDIIIVGQDITVSDLVRRTRLHLDSVAPSEQYNIVRHLER